jgi:hydroxymethylglutaryl-CoA lyase
MTPIIIHEVGPRDGLQNERQVPLALKERWIRGLMGSGLDVVQVGSFVHPAKVPQMADTDELVRLVAALPGPRAALSGLVLNEPGLERALACGVDLICMGVSASDTHSRKNTGMGMEEAQRRVLAMAAQAQAAGRKVQVSVQSAFGCGFEGRIPESRVLAMAGAFLEAGLGALSLADTAGHAHPGQVRRLFGAVAGLGPVQCCAHFHDTYGLGMANVYAAMDLGVAAFETSFGGLGGCPFTRVAAGNVATEDLVHGLGCAGMRRDIDLGLLVSLAREAAAFFGRDLAGRVHRAGPLEYGS